MTSQLFLAAQAVVREALDKVEVHPCDERDDAVRAKGLYGPVQELHAALAQEGESSREAFERIYADLCIEGGRATNFDYVNGTYTDFTTYDEFRLFDLAWQSAIASRVRESAKVFNDPNRPHNFGLPMGYAVVSKSNGMLDGGSHTRKHQAQAVLDSGEYNNHRIVALTADTLPFDTGIPVSPPEKLPTEAALKQLLQDAGFHNGVGPYMASGQLRNFHRFYMLARRQ